MRSTLLIPIAACLLSCGPASERIPEIRLAIGGRAALDFVPVYIGSSLGFFRDAGLNVTIQDLPGTAKAVQSLLGGSSDLVAGGYDAAIEMAAQGKHLQSVAVIERWPPFVLLASNSTGQTRTVRDLKGLTVGIASPGSSTHRFLNYLLTKNGLTPSDIKPVGVGVNFTMAAAVEHGQVQAAIAGPLGRALLEKNRGCENDRGLSDSRRRKRLARNRQSSLHCLASSIGMGGRRTPRLCVKSGQL